MSERIAIAIAGEGDLAAVRDLFLDYAKSLNFSLCFQGFDEELKTLPGAYAPPRGRLLIARAGDKSAAGCVALRPLRDGACEMKRLYVRPEFRGRGLGRRLAETIIAAGRELGYSRMALDTVATMSAAMALYRDLGFAETKAYYDNPLPDVRYFARAL